jgi:hypothetical protein
MKLKIFLESILTGVVLIILFLLFQKVSNIKVPSWLGGIIILSAIILLIRLKK